MSVSLGEMIAESAESKTDGASQADATNTDTTEDTTATEVVENAGEASTDGASEPEPATSETQESGSDEAGENDASAIREYAKSVLGKDAHKWIDKYSNDDEFLRGVAELEKLVGKRNEDSQVVKYLQENGVTAADIQRLIEGRSKPQEKPTVKGDTDEWDPKWVTVVNNQVIPTADAPSNIADLLAKREALFREAVYDSSKFAKLVAPHIEKDIEAKSKAEVDAMRAELAQKEEAASFQKWTDQKRSLLFVEGSEDQLTPLGMMVEERLKSGKVNQSLSWIEQAEDALDWAIAKSKPNPTVKKPNPKAKHEPTPNATGTRKLTIEEFSKKYGERLSDWVSYQADGTLPSTA